MQYRRVGKSRLRVSSIGFGTCQLRLVTEQQAIDTLKKGFDLGVNVVHTAPDYEGTVEIVAQSIEESGYNVIVASQGYGDLAHFEWLFETTCRTLKKRSLEIFGIACIDDREHLGENVWDPGGMVEFLLKKKQDGRLAAVFCTTHGTPEYIKKLITSGVFDAIMVSYNPLGFHLLSYYPEPPKTPENISSHKQEIFSLAARHDVALMIMKPLAGGLLCDSKAFPPHADFCPRPRKLGARDILRSMLLNDEICCVFPGTASVEEAEENALSGMWVAAKDDSWLKDIAGKVVKIVSPLLYNLPLTYKYKIIFIKRHMEEIFASQNKMLERSGRESHIEDSVMGEKFEAHLKKVHRWIEKQKNIDCLYVSYNEIIQNPLPTVSLVGM